MHSHGTTTVTKSFNPRTREGCDLFGVQCIVVHFMFQSTHPRGVRHALTWNDYGDEKFQSTHPRGVRLDNNVQIYWQEPVSIHAPARGATDCGMYGLRRLNGFNPRTREGCDSPDDLSGKIK